MNLRLFRYLLCCLHSSSASSERDPSQRIHISEVVDQAPAPIIEESREIDIATEPAESFSEPGQSSEDRKEIIIPESRSLIFTDFGVEEKLAENQKKKRRLKGEKSKKGEEKKRKRRYSEGKRHTPPPRDAKPLKSILKKR